MDMMHKRYFIFVILFFQLSIVTAQDSSSFKLQKPNLILEYQTYDPELANFGKIKQYHPSTRLVYTVRSTEKDSAGNVVVNLTKQGFAFNTEKQFSWETKEQLSFSKDNIFFPAGFYISDTTFLCDYKRNAPPYQKRPMVYSVMKFENQKMPFPFSMQKDEQLPFYNIAISGRINDPDIANMDAFVSGKRSSNASSKASAKLNAKLNFSIVVRKVIGKTKVTTPAGVFECYKILEVLELDRRNNPRAEHYVYLSPEYGIVKIEPVDMNKPAYYVVLTKIRNK